MYAPNLINVLNLYFILFQVIEAVYSNGVLIKYFISNWANRKVFGLVQDKTGRKYKLGFIPT